MKKSLSTQDRLNQADTYSRFVAMMRYVLPTAAVVLGIVLLIWPNPNGDERHLPVSTMGIREMVNPHYRGVNQKGEPMEVYAARAVQAGDMKDVIALEQITAKLDRQSGGMVTLTAQKGTYDQKKNRVTLEQAVHIVDTAGYDLTTDLATIDLNTPVQAEGNKPVTGTSPKGAVSAQGFRITDEGKTVIFTGRSQLQLKGSTNP